MSSRYILRMKKESGQCVYYTEDENGNALFAGEICDAKGMSYESCLHTMHLISPPMQMTNSGRRLNDTIELSIVFSHNHYFRAEYWNQAELMI